MLIMEASIHDGVSSKHQIEYSDTSDTRAVHGDDAEVCGRHGRSAFNISIVGALGLGP